VSIVDFRPALRTFFLAEPAIAALVVARVFPLRLPQGEKKTSIVYTTISGRGDHHSQGSSGLARPRVQIDAWSPSIDDADQLARLIKNRIDGYSGDMGSGSSVVNVQGVFFVDEREDYDRDVEMFRMSKDYFIWFGER